MRIALSNENLHPNVFQPREDRRMPARTGRRPRQLTPPRLTQGMALTNEPDGAAIVTTVAVRYGAHVLRRNARSGGTRGDGAPGITGAREMTSLLRVTGTAASVGDGANKARHASAPRRHARHRISGHLWSVERLSRVIPGVELPLRSRGSRRRGNKAQAASGTRRQCRVGVGGTRSGKGTAQLPDQGDHPDAGGERDSARDDYALHMPFLRTDTLDARRCGAI